MKGTQLTDFDIFGDDDKPTEKAGGGKIVSTYKEGAGFDASWTVVHASSVDDWFAIHSHPRFQELLDIQKKTAGEFRGGAVQAAPSRGAGPAGASAPSRPDNVPEHFTFRSGVKNGKAWKGWFPPQGSGEQPVWG